MTTAKSALEQVLSELREEREIYAMEIEELDIVIRRLEERLSKPGPSGRQARPSGAEEMTGQSEQADALPFVGMSNAEAAKVYLESSDAVRTTVEVRQALKEGGMESDAQSYHATVYTALKRLADRGEIQDLGDGRWAPLSVEAEVATSPDGSTARHTSSS